MSVYEMHTKNGRMIEWMEVISDDDERFNFNESLFKFFSKDYKSRAGVLEKRDNWGNIKREAFQMNFQIGFKYSHWLLSRCFQLNQKSFYFNNKYLNQNFFWSDF